MSATTCWKTVSPSSPPKAQPDGYGHLQIAMEEAICAGKADTLEDILHILTTVDSSWTQKALCLALDHDQLSCVELLVDSKAMVKSRRDSISDMDQPRIQRYGVAVALSSVCQDMTQMEKLLLWAKASGVNIMAQHSELNGTLMHFAAQEDNAKLVNVLYNQGMDPFCRDKRGNTPMHEAARLCNGEAVKALLGTCGPRHHQEGSGQGSEECDSQTSVHCDFLNALNDNQESPLNIAVCMKWKYILQLLCSHGTDLNTYVGNYTALHRAIMEEDAECVHILLEGNANACLRTRCEMRCTPLIMAVQSQDISMVKLITQQACVLDAYDAMNGLTALHFSVIQDDGFDCFKHLLECGCDINVTAEDGRTALMFAVSYDHHDCLCRLLQSPGCDVNMADRQWGMTALHRATDIGCCFCTIQLLQSGANPDIEDSDKVTPLLLAVNSHSLKVVKKLLSWGCSTTHPQSLTIALDRNYVEVVRALVLATEDFGPIRKYMRTRHYEMLALTLTTFTNWLGEIATNARSLKELTRLAVRKAVGWNFPNKSAHLPLPKELKEFVQIPEFSFTSWSSSFDINVS